MSDEFIYEFNKEGASEKKFIMQEKHYVFKQDNSGGGGSGAYPGNQVVFELENFTSPDCFDSYAESFIAMPLKLAMEAVGGSFAPAINGEGLAVGNDFALCLKNGIHNLIDNCKIEIDGVVANNAVPMSNLEMGWRLHKMGLDEMNNYQDVMNYALDTADSIRNYGNVPTEYGLGEVNNVIKESLFDPAKGYYNETNMVNKGRQERMKVTSNNPDSNDFVKYYISSRKTLENHWISGVSRKTATVIEYDIFAIIPLPIIHTLFASLPLARGVKLRITLNMNTGCSATFAFSNPAGADDIKGKYLSYSTVTPNITLPFQISPIQGGFYPGKALGALATLELTNSVLKTCRFYACRYKLAPEYERDYIKSPLKLVTYNDFIIRPLPNVKGGEPVQFTVNTSTQKLRYLLIIPQLSSQINSTSTTTFGSVYSSPFSSAPGTCCVGGKIQNLQVSVGGKNIYNNVGNYSFEHYLEQLRPELSINGGSLNSHGLCSGNISKTMWEKGYGYYFVDLSRHSDVSMDNVPKDVTVYFINNSDKNIDYQFLLANEKNFTLHCSTGEIVNGELRM